MESGNVANIANNAKEAVSSSTGLPVSSMNVYEYSRQGENYVIGIESNATGNMQHYRVTLDDTGNVIEYHKVQPHRKDSSDTIVFIALIFSFISFLVALILTLSLIVSIFIMAILLLAYLLINIFCLVRIIQIKRAMDKGDMERAIKLNSTLFGIVALIFNGLITGVLLLISRSSMEASVNGQY